MTIDLPSPPPVNTYWRRVGNRTLLSKRARDFKATVATRCMIARVKPIDGPVVVSVVWRRPKRTGDVDGIAKGLLDSLNGFAYRDDNQVVELHLYRTDDKANPGVTVTVQAA